MAKGEAAEIYEEKMVYAFIDASNLWAVQKSKKRFFDLEKVIKYLTYRFHAKELKVFYYTAYPAEGTRSYELDSKHKFFTYLKKGLGIEVRKKPLKRIVTDHQHGLTIQEKGNMDVEMTIDSLHHMRKYTTAIFFTGDSDFLALISYLKNAGKKVYVFSSKNNVSHELKTGANGYTDLLDIEDDIWGRELQYRHKDLG